MENEVKKLKMKSTCTTYRVRDICIYIKREYVNYKQFQNDEMLNVEKEASTIILVCSYITIFSAVPEFTGFGKGAI